MTDFTVLEPATAGDIIDRSIRLYRQNFVAVVSIVAAPALIGLIANLSFWLGYSRLLLGTSTGGQMGALGMLLVGLVCYPLWYFSLLTAISGLSRLVGDHIMLGLPITFKRVLPIVRKRLGDIILMGLLSVVILIVVYIIIGGIAFLAFMVGGVVVFVIGSVGAPEWMIVTATIAVVLVMVFLAAMAILVVISRVILLPQVVMIENQSAGSAISRAMSLGAKNWYRVGGIALFAYFVNYSIVSALMIPLLIGRGLAGDLGLDFFAQSGWNLIYPAVSQFASLLILPIWGISLTMLYFDSRVRKEGYDVEVLARQIQGNAEGGFVWQPTHAQTLGYQVRIPKPGYVPTSPLGLGGWVPPPSTDSVAANPMGQPASGWARPVPTRPGSILGLEVPVRRPQSQTAPGPTTGPTTRPGGPTGPIWAESPVGWGPPGAATTADLGATSPPPMGRQAPVLPTVPGTPDWPGSAPVLPSPALPDGSPSLASPVPERWNRSSDNSGVDSGRTAGRDVGGGAPTQPLPNSYISAPESTAREVQQASADPGACLRCGSQLDMGARFCHICGQKVGG